MARLYEIDLPAGTRPAANSQTLGSSRARNFFERKENTRSSTRMTFVSTKGTLLPDAKQRTALAVYGPTPGSSVSLEKSRGTRPIVLLTRRSANSLRSRARSAMPRSRISLRRLVSSALVRVWGVGYLSMKLGYTCATFAVSVFRSMISAINISNAVRFPALHANRRLFRAYHVKRAF
jgi:hypothetical protein